MRVTDGVAALRRGEAAGWPTVPRMGTGRVWWRQDRRWAPRAGVVATAGIAGGFVAWWGSGIEAVLGAETGIGLAAGFTVATGTALRQAWRGRADDDPGSYADGVPVELIATRAHPDATIAKLTAAGDALAELHLETLHPDDGPAGGIDSVTARVDGKVLRLQHRHPATTGTTDDPSAGGTENDLAAGGLDLEVRWVTNDGHPAAVAARVPGPDGESWSVTGRNITVAWTLPRETGRRPTRRVTPPAAGGCSCSSTAGSAPGRGRGSPRPPNSTPPSCCCACGYVTYSTPTPPARRRGHGRDRSGPWCPTTSPATASDLPDSETPRCCPPAT